MTTSRPQQILVVEDDSDTAELVCEVVNDHFGRRCVLCCRTLAETAPVDLNTIDIALVDYNLPDADGLRALATLLERREDLPVIIVTGERHVGTAIEAIRRGAADYIVKLGDFVRTIPIFIEKNMEIARMRRENMRLHAALSSSLAELKRKNRDLEAAASMFERMASTDLLTDLANRRRLEERLRVMFADAIRYGGDLSCLMIDLDGFKAINDTLGHQMGDELLALTGRIINEQIRTSDVGARYGGDEFVVALPHTPHDTAVMLAQRLSNEFTRQASALIGDRLRTGMSIGVACLMLSRPLDPRQLVAHADNALYTAKMSGRSKIMVCGPDGVTALTPDAIAA